MPTPINWARWGLYKSTIEAALVEGFAPYRQEGGKGSAVAEAGARLGLGPSVMPRFVIIQERRAARGQDHRLPEWSLYRSRGTPHRTAESRVVRRWLLTAAQNETPVHVPFWNNLQSFATYMGADIVVAPFTYQIGLFSDHAARAGVFAEAVRPFLRFESLDIGPAVFCAEMNTLPTANRPLSGLHTYTRGRWGVFPHAKMALESVPAMPGQGAPLIMTTGCCTVENYIAKKAGLVAAFHHVVGALLAELDDAGRVYFRQINAEADGSFQDLENFCREGKIFGGQRVEAITWGDVHRYHLDPDVARGAWGFDVAANKTTAFDSMLDRLRPRYQFFHDLVDFQARNPHQGDDPHSRFALHCAGKDSLEREFADAAHFVRQTERDWCKSVIVESNHDAWLNGWLKKADYRKDEVNALFFLRMQLAAYEARARGDADFNAVRHALRAVDPARLDGIEFVPEQGSFIICGERGGIECGAHGHLGTNGARGTPINLTRVAMKMNTGHTHSASIFDGVYTAGVSAKLFMDYNRGPSSWSHSHIVTYPTGKRAVVTMHGNRWRA